MRCKFRRRSDVPCVVDTTFFRLATKEPTGRTFARCRKYPDAFGFHSIFTRPRWNKTTRRRGTEKREKEKEMSVPPRTRERGKGEKQRDGATINLAVLLWAGPEASIGLPEEREIKLPRTRVSRPWKITPAGRDAPLRAARQARDINIFLAIPVAHAARSTNKDG